MTMPASPISVAASAITATAMPIAALTIPPSWAAGNVNIRNPAAAMRNGVRTRSTSSPSPSMSDSTAITSRAVMASVETIEKHNAVSTVMVLFLSLEPEPMTVLRIRIYEL